MSESQITPQQQTNGDGQKAPPFVQIVKTGTGCQFQTNIVDPFLALALIEMGKQSLFDAMKPKVAIPPVGMAGLMKRMQG